jgi:translation initiation factor 3 subunit L
MSYVNGNRQQLDDDDLIEETLVADYQEQVNYNEGENLEQTNSIPGGPADLRAQLEAAAAPLEYQASLETKFSSYDNYCSLFHYILNSDGPVDIEQPSYYWAWDVIDEFIYQFEVRFA